MSKKKTTKDGKPVDSDNPDKINLSGLSKNQIKFIDSMIPNYFNITDICQIVGIHRSTYYDWLEIPEFKQAHDNARQYITDKAEEVLLKSVELMDLKSAKFILSKLRSEYKDKIDITSGDKPITNIQFNLITKKKENDSDSE